MPKTLFSEEKTEMAEKILRDIVKKIRKDTSGKPETLGYKHDTLEALEYDRVHAGMILSSLNQLYE